ncbi:hypothetical protein F9C07_2107 [Aspergillus flavus]|uniref:Uncharacterized protein n=1 Tax=Aspergillus flavus (strain ATCC 200026 / FGSC A1120 / IAM 13836 / NRRL 3357 / JCM 12722 / SRRC 167) TaxID=332952 RepID=A0A7U2QSB5_ASPFN|nr:hypothetical protein F9C07_2107 [Aspergillus flavus]
MRYLVVFVIFQFSPAVPAALLLSRLFPVLFLSASDSPRSKEQASVKLAPVREQLEKKLHLPTQQQQQQSWLMAVHLKWLGCNFHQT